MKKSERCGIAPYIGLTSLLGKTSKLKTSYTLRHMRSSRRSQLPDFKAHMIKMRGNGCGEGHYEKSLSILIRTVDAYHVRFRNGGETLNIFNTLLRLNLFNNEAILPSSFSLGLVLT